MFPMLSRRRRLNPQDGAMQTEYDASELKLPKFSNLIIILMSNLLMQISFFIVVSSSNAYSEHLGGTSTFSGVVIGIPTVFSGLTLIPMIKFDKGGYRRPLHVTCCALILGHILYAVAYRAGYLYLILLGRIVNGIGFSFWTFTKRYCTDARIVGIRRRTTLASWLVIGQGLGMSLGPFAGGLLFRVGFKSSVFNGFTSPGWIMAAIWSIFWVCVVIWYEDPPPKSDARELRVSEVAMLPPMQSSPGTTNDSSLHSHRHSSSSKHPSTTTSIDRYIKLIAPQQGVVFCMCWFAMTCFFILGAWESNLPVFGAHLPKFHWSPFAAGNFISLGGISAFPFLLVSVQFARRIQDRTTLAFGAGLGLSGLLIFIALLRTDAVAYGSLFVCWWAVALGFNLATTVTLSLLSKQLPPESNNWTSVVIQCSNYTGRVTGAVWGGSGVKVGMINYVALEMTIVGVGVVLFLVLWRDLKAKKG